MIAFHLVTESSGRRKPEVSRQLRSDRKVGCQWRQRCLIRLSVLVIKSSPVPGGISCPDVIMFVLTETYVPCHVVSVRC